MGGDGAYTLSTALLHRFRFSWPSCDLGEERSLVGCDDGHLGISVCTRCYGVCFAIEGNACPEVDAWKGGLGKMR